MGYAVSGASKVCKGLVRAARAVRPNDERRDQQEVTEKTENVSPVSCASSVPSVASCWLYFLAPASGRAGFSVVPPSPTGAISFFLFRSCQSLAQAIDREGVADTYSPRVGVAAVKAAFGYEVANIEELDRDRNMRFEIDAARPVMRILREARGSPSL